LLSDIGLPDGDGYRLMRELKDLQGLKGIALTGYGLDDDIALSREAGFAVHITKPVQIHLLDAALDDLAPRRAGGAAS
jgi:CheY-like chemotaxis protein